MVRFPLAWRSEHPVLLLRGDGRTTSKSGGSLNLGGGIVAQTLRIAGQDTRKEVEMTQEQVAFGFIERHNGHENNHQKKKVHGWLQFAPRYCAALQIEKITSTVKVSAAQLMGELSEDDKDCYDSTDEEDTSKSGAEDSDGQVEACARLQDALRDGCLVPSDLEGNSEPQIPNDRATAGSFIHRFFWGLQQGVETEINNVCRLGLRLYCHQQEKFICRCDPGDSPA
ncbi:hypothetical protein B0H16DRAFT_1767312 [Mycena metata]|uniref:Uncharacterized protein n=1 Tax=Mycena metata TaxID=1033252 RepID=A0AAD7I3T8_9AGAR|nr:hypothetical protein B0H16DRAFT_1767312 [Mycena metata]